MKPARLATVLAALIAAGALSSPADAAIFGGRKANEAKKEAAAKAAAAAEPAGPKPASAQDRATAERLEPLARVAFWSREMQINPTDPVAGTRLAAALRTLGRYDEAAVMAGQVLVLQPDNVEALLEDGRAKIGGGGPFYAIQPLTRAKQLAPKDWRPLSLLGVAYEQTQRPDEARAAYLAALALSPENPAVLSNLALLHAGRGERDQAETLLRRAVANPAAGARERQNLALILGLQGKLGEAERLLRQDLPPQLAEQNLAWLKGAPAESAVSATNRNWGALGGQ